MSLPVSSAPSQRSPTTQGGDGPDIRSIPGKVQLEQFDVTTLSKEKIRELFRTGKVPTAEAMVDELLLRALKARATEIHLEPLQSCLQIRLGFNGVLQRLVSLPKEVTENLTSVMKTKAGLNAIEKRKPLEGRFTWSINNLSFDFRVNTMPVMTGERILMKVLYQRTQVEGLTQVGFSPENLVKVTSLLNHSSGLVLIGGPTGSGKTSTAYAAINELYRPELNIITVEDPIEYKLDYAAQIQVSGTDGGVGYEEALHSTMRQNPSAILVGEIRTAEAGIAAAEAALAGSLVISTILAGNAMGVIIRLTNIGVPAYWLGSSLLGVISQRLLPKLCSACKEPFIPTDEALSTLGFADNKGVSLFRPKGCPQCNRSGYEGRIAVHGVLEIDDAMRDLIFQQAPVSQIREAATTFKPAREDARKRILEGIISPDDFLRTFG